jgi:hypothetical protein
VGERQRALPIGPLGPNGFVLVPRALGPLATGDIALRQSEMGADQHHPGASSKAGKATRGHADARTTTVKDRRQCP